MGLSFAPLTAAEVGWVREQLDRAREFVREFDPEGAVEPSSLEALDRAFANYLEAGAEPGMANGVVLAVGAAFGAELVESLGFAWIIATDEAGSDLAVLARPGRGDVTIFPTEFVAKRYERREAPFLAAAVAEIRHHLAEIAAMWDDPA